MCLVDSIIKNMALVVGCVFLYHIDSPKNTIFENCFALATDFNHLVSYDSCNSINGAAFWYRTFLVMIRCVCVRLNKIFDLKYLSHQLCGACVCWVGQLN